MDDDLNQQEPKVQADNNSIAVGGISVGGDISGNITIGNTGYTSEEVSVLIAQIQTTFRPKAFDGRCPYKGLDVFEEEDAELFFGREKLVDDLVSRVKESRTVFITGPSGSGKSSLVRAGLIHALKQGAIKESKSERWLYATCKPGRDPLEALKNVFSRLKTPELGNYFQQNISKPGVLHECAEAVLSEQKDQRLVLFIDQFEEVFTQISNEDERVTLLNLLTHAATVENGRVINLFSMRSDFVSNCATYPELNALLNQQFIQIGAMQPYELVSAIAQPALRVGLPIDPDLIAQIINDMQGEPGALPLMQFALKDLFDSQYEKGGVIALTLNDYLQRGGIHKSLERHADKTFAEFNAEEQELAHSIFSGLIEIGRGTQDTRRTANFDELIPSSAKVKDIETIVQKLANARLITTDEQAGKDTVTISHEKLIDAWPWLKKLVNENRDVIALQNEITADAKEWEDHKCDTSYLYTGARLVNASEQLNARKLVLSGISHEFVQSGLSRQQRDRLKRILSTAGIVSLIASVILYFPYNSAVNSAKLAQQNSNFANTQVVLVSTAQANAEEARRQAEIARVGELSALASLKSTQDYDQALLFGVEALNLAEQSGQNEARASDAMTELLQGNTGLKLILKDVGGEITSVAFSSDGKILAAAGTFSGTSVSLWDISNLDSPKKLQDIWGADAKGISRNIQSIAFSPITTTMAFQDSTGNIFFWDTSKPDQLSQVGELLSQDDSFYSSSNIAYNADGKILASSNGDGGIILWDVRDPHSPKQINVMTQISQGSGLSLAWNPTRNTLAVGDCAKYDDTDSCSEGRVSLWDLENLINPVKLGDFGEQAGEISGLVFTLDGTMLASSSSDTTVVLWNIVTPSNPIKITTLRGHTKSVNSIAFNSDGKTFASASDWDVLLWDISSPTAPVLINTFRNHTNVVNSIAFSPNGETLVSGGNDKRVLLWNTTATAIPPIQASKINGSILLAINPDGNILASIDSSNALTLWNIAYSEKPVQLSSIQLNSTESVTNMVFVPDSTMLIITECVNRDDNYNCTESKIGALETSNPTNLIQIILKNIPGDILGLAINSTGSMVALGICKEFANKNNICSQSQVDLFAFSRDKFNSLTTINIPDFSLRKLIFTPDEKELIIDNDLEILIWDITSVTKPKQLSSLEDSSGSILDMAIDADGKILALGTYQEISYWNITDSNNPIKLGSLHGYSSFVTSVSFDAEGKILASGSEDRNLILWDLSDQYYPVPAYTFSGLDEIVDSVFLSPDGKSLISRSRNGSIIIWDLDPQSWIQKACQIAGRNFSQTEWQQYFPGEVYRTTCSQWPLEP